MTYLVKANSDPIIKTRARLRVRCSSNVISLRWHHIKARDRANKAMMTYSAVTLKPPSPGPSIKARGNNPTQIDHSPSALHRPNTRGNAQPDAARGEGA